MEIVECLYNHQWYGISHIVVVSTDDDLGHIYIIMSGKSWCQQS